MGLDPLPGNPKIRGENARFDVGGGISGVGKDSGMDM